MDIDVTTLIPAATSSPLPSERAFGFIRMNERAPKPRHLGITEIRGPYYAPVGRRYLEDVLETMGAYVDALKFAGGSFSLMPRTVVSRLIEICARVVSALGLERVMFEAADPAVFAWYIKNYGPEVNLFIDHSQIVQLECLRSGIWGTKSLWGRIKTFKETGRVPSAPDQE